MNAADLVELQHTLYTSRNPTRQWLHNTRRAWISAAVRSFGPQQGGARGLEIGPGSGIYIPVLKEVCSEVYVSDCERAYLNAIDTSYANDPTIKLVVDDITHSALPSEHFDLVLCTEVVEHIANSAAAFQHIARILKPTGVLVLSTPQRYSLLKLTARLALSRGLIWFTRLVYREPVLEMGHINLMTATTVLAQLSEANLCVRHQHKAGLYLPGIAEFCGKLGQFLESWLEIRFHRSWLDGALWTQYYVVTRRSPDLAGVT